MVLAPNNGQAQRGEGTEMALEAYRERHKAHAEAVAREVLAQLAELSAAFTELEFDRVNAEAESDELEYLSVSSMLLRKVRALAHLAETYEQLTAD